MSEQLLHSLNPKTNEKVGVGFVEASSEEIRLVVANAAKAFTEYQWKSGKERAQFLEEIANRIENAGDDFIKTVMQESGLPEGRVRGERGRTCGQLRAFAKLLKEGNWIEATIDRANPDRKPMPKADIRKMLRPIGPVLVFTASNFPLAFSTAGGDTASALASGCSVIVKSHPSHLNTNNLVSEIIIEAAAECNMPEKVFQTINIENYTLAGELITDEKINAIAFTGSHKGGKAIYDLAQKRKTLIPVFAEMGSVNPICILPNILENDISGMAGQIANSVNLGAGQFCTNPGLIFYIKDQNEDSFLNALKESFDTLPHQTMLNKGIHENYCQLNDGIEANNSINYYSSAKANDVNSAFPAFGTCEAQDFLKDDSFQAEVFGPFTLLVGCSDLEEMNTCIESLKGQLTGSILGTDIEIDTAIEIYRSLQNKVGRVIFNGVPTGVEVCSSMLHGGPYPASTDSRFTSVGTSAIKRFVRPVSYQNVLDQMLPQELQNENPLKIQRLVDSKWTDKKL